MPHPFMPGFCQVLIRKKTVTAIKSIEKVLQIYWKCIGNAINRIPRSFRDIRLMFSPNSISYIDFYLFQFYPWTGQRTVSLAFLTMFSTVKPNSSNRMLYLPDAPK